MCRGAHRKKDGNARSPKLRCLDRPVAVPLEQYVPTDHCARHLDATLDLSVIRGWVANRCASIGRLLQFQHAGRFVTRSGEQEGLPKVDNPSCSPSRDAFEQDTGDATRSRYEALPSSDSFAGKVVQPWSVTDVDKTMLPL